MKKKLFTFVLLLLLSNLFAQSPSKLSYQGVVRNSSGILVTNSPIGIRISLKQGSTAGNIVYSEIHTETTNENGLFTLEIGEGNVVDGKFSSIDWARGPFYITTEIDLMGGNNYTISNTSQMMSVPYALYAEKSGVSINSLNCSGISSLPVELSNIQTKLISNLSTNGYTVPNGKLFIIFAGIMKGNSGTSFGGGVTYAGGSGDLTFPSVAYKPTILVNSGKTISATNNLNTFLGYLIDENQIIENKSNDIYTVPEGKTLVILEASFLNLDGISLSYNVNVFNGSQPLVISSGTTIKNYFIGYLK
ncbi:hypothetical protein PG593_11040 [Riemerella anatipestifer]|nr:hypothetical protein [Riemerella anatipestifer]